MNTQRFGKVFIPYGLLGLSLGIAFLPIILGQDFFYSYDLLYQNFWWRDFARWSLLHGHLPLTYYGEGCGAPLLAEGQIGFFYPINLFLYWMFDTWTGLQISIIFHTIWALFGSYFLSKSLNASRLMSVLIACSFTYSGFMCIHATQVNLQAAASWLPWILLFLNHYLKGTKGASLLLGLSISMPFLAGHPQVGLYSILCTTIWVLFFKCNLWIKFRTMLIITAGVLVAGIQLVPSYVFFHSSNRIGQTISEALSYSANPKLIWRCWTFIPPPPIINTWTVFFQKEYNPSTLIESFQTIGLMLGPLFAIIGLNILWILAKKRETIIKRNVVWFSIIWLLITLGKWGGLHWFLSLLPGFSGMRAPARAGFVLALMISLSIGLWLPVILPKNRLIRYLLLATALVVCVIIVPMQLPLLNPTISKDLTRVSIELIQFNQQQIAITKGIGTRLDWEPTMLKSGETPKLPSERVQKDIKVSIDLRPIPTVRTAGPVRLKELDQILNQLDHAESPQEYNLILERLKVIDFNKDWSFPLYIGGLISIIGLISITIASTSKYN